MSRAEDPRCPECGEPIGQTATYCMHCSADLSDHQEAADTDADEAREASGFPRGSVAARRVVSLLSRTYGGNAGAGRSAGGIEDRPTPDSAGETARAEERAGGGLLDPHGLVDNTLTVVVGIVGGLVVGLISILVLGGMTGTGWSMPLAFVAWLGATAYLVRRRTVQGAVEKTGYAVAVVLLLIPVTAFSPLLSVDGGLRERAGLFAVLFLTLVVPASIAAILGWVAGRFVPQDIGRR